jgi:hypothetical protein
MYFCAILIRGNVSPNEKKQGQNPIDGLSFILLPPFKITLILCIKV